MRAVDIQQKHQASYQAAMMDIESTKSRLLYLSVIPNRIPVPGEGGLAPQVVQMKRSKHDQFIFEVLKGKELFSGDKVHLKEALGLGKAFDSKVLAHATIGCGEEFREMQVAQYNHPDKDVEELYLDMIELKSEAEKLSQEQPVDHVPAMEPTQKEGPEIDDRPTLRPRP